MWRERWKPSPPGIPPEIYWLHHPQRCGKTTKTPSRRYLSTLPRWPDSFPCASISIPAGHDFWAPSAYAARTGLPPSAEGCCRFLLGAEGDPSSSQAMNRATSGRFSASRGDGYQAVPWVGDGDGGELHQAAALSPRHCSCRSSANAGPFTSTASQHQTSRSRQARGDDRLFPAPARGCTRHAGDSMEK